MRLRFSSSAIAVAAALAVADPAARADYPPISLSSYNLIVTQNLGTSSHDQGYTAVGGNVTPFGSHGSDSSDFVQNNNTIASTANSVIVGGNVAVGQGGTLGIEHGNLLLGGSVVSGTVQINGGSLAGQTPNYNHDATLGNGAFTNALQGYLTGESNALNSMALGQGTTASLPTGGQQGQFTFDARANANGVAFINVDSSIFSNPYINQIDLTTLHSSYAVTSVILNVTGSPTVDFTSNANFVGYFTNASTRQSLLWNFDSATSLNFEGKNFQGSVLAPIARLTIGGNVDGSVFVQNFQQGAEVHLANPNDPAHPYTGYIAPVPEPGSIALLGLGIPAALVLIRRKSA